MCGIAGILSNQPIDLEIVKSLNAPIAHRGPDDSGLFLSEDRRIGFAHRRLAILDLSPAGHQPMFSPDGRYCIVYNGEIYNHWEIRKQLLNKHSFRSTSDTETLLIGFIEYGEKIVEQLNGIFAFAIYDKQTGEVFIARDHFGIKPLYYYSYEGVFLFGSEIKSLLQYRGINKTLDYTALVNYINYLYCPAPQTPFKYVHKLEPGQYLRVNASNPQAYQIATYYDIPFTGEYAQKSEKQWIDELDEHLYKAVERQMLSDVPVGFFLSGGLDSSLIVAMAKRIRPQATLPCYTIDTGDGKAEYDGFSNDLFYAKLVADYLKVDLRLVRADPDMIDKIDLMVYHLDEPQGDTAPLNVLNICQQARAQGEIVMLGGTGGDDVFSGYRRHQALQLERYFRLIPPPLGKLLKSISLSLDSNKPLYRRIRKLTNGLDKSAAARFAAYHSWISPTINKQLFSPSCVEAIKDYDPDSPIHKALQRIPQERNLLNRMLYTELKFFLADHNLNYTDKLSMATSVEVRVPYLDTELVAFSATIPPNLKLKGNETKYLLKKVAERYIPKEVIYRPKTGFGTPIRDWIANGQIQRQMDSYLAPEALTRQGIFSPQAVSKMIAENKAGRHDYSVTLLSLLVIGSWYHQYIEQ